MTENYIFVVSNTWTMFVTIVLQYMNRIATKFTMTNLVVGRLQQEQVTFAQTYILIDSFNTCSLYCSVILLFVNI